MKYIKIIDQDKGEGKWRVILDADNTEDLVLKIENFKYGSFKTGETFDKVYRHKGIPVVSIITENYENITRYDYVQKVVDAFYHHIDTLKKEKQEQFDTHLRWYERCMNTYNSALKQAPFRKYKIQNFISDIDAND
jgi:hypothetical protein